MLGRVFLQKNKKNSMSRKLPPLKALLAFETAARLGSFTRAAEELCVTQAAISQQVRHLEESLALKLFNRHPRHLSLTRNGERLLPELTDAFNIMSDALSRLGEQKTSPRLTVSLTPALAAKWLILRLPAFWRLYPDIDLRLHHSITSVDFVNDDVDLAIRWGEGDWPGLVSEFLIPGELIPVCSPALLHGRYPLRTPSDLMHHTLLHEDSYADWHDWLSLAGNKTVKAGAGPIIDDSNALLLAAADGQGVALGRMALIGDDLAAGRLVKPFGVSLRQKNAYYLVYPEEQSSDPKMQAFRSFLKQQVMDSLES